MVNGGEPIPQKLREAFDQAVSVYSSWTPLLPERLVTIDDRFFTMSEVCGLVDKFRDALPMPAFDRLSSYMAEHKQYARLCRPSIPPRHTIGRRHFGQRRTRVSAGPRTSPHFW